MKHNNSIDHYRDIELSTKGQFLAFFILGVIYIDAAAFILFKGISVCQHQKKKLQYHLISFYSAFVFTVFIRGLAFILYISAFNFSRNVLQDPPPISYKILNLFMDIPVLFQNIAIVVFVCTLLYIRKIWDSGRKAEFKKQRKRLLIFLNLQFIGGLLLYFLGAYCYNSELPYFIFLFIVYLCIIFIMAWGGFPFINYLKHNWSGLYGSVKWKLWISLLCGLSTILLRLFYIIFSMTYYIQYLIESSYDDGTFYYVIFVFFYTLFVEIFPIVCFAFFLTVQKQKILLYTYINPIQNDHLLHDDTSDSYSSPKAQTQMKVINIEKSSSCDFNKLGYGKGGIYSASKSDRVEKVKRAKVVGGAEFENICGNRVRLGSDPNDIRKRTKY